MNNIQDFGIWFLILSLILPRFVLFFWWVTGNLPHNTTPFLVDMFSAIFIPRILILVWIYSDLGMCVWFWLHLVVMLISYTFTAIRLFIKKINE